MMAIANTVDLIAEQLQKPACAPAPFQRPHVFHSMLAYCGKKETAATRMDMMYRFSQCQRCLNSLLNGKQGLADSLIESMEREVLQLSSVAAHAAMDAIFSSAVAYRHYVLRDYAAALACLDHSMDCLDRLYEDGFDDVVPTMLDMLMNRVRVHVAENRLELAIASAVDLLTCLYSGRAEISRTNANFSAMPKAELDSLISAFTDAVIGKLVSTNDHAFIQSFFDRLFATLPQWSAGALRSAFQHYSRVLANADCDETDLEFLHGASITTLPVSLQCLIVSAHLRKSRQALDAAATAVIDRHFAAFPQAGKLRKCSWLC
jgi:predicted Zn-dependent protease with MMP-like domain